MWCDLTKEWQRAFEEAWISFQGGSIPIGAIITDQNGNVLMTGRNESGEGRYPNHRVAHAEASCVRNLDIEKYPDFNEYHLYTTMEPCPMCMGTIVMGGIRNVHVASKDRYCGALHYVEDDPYMKAKGMHIFLEEGEMEAVQLTQQTYHGLCSDNGQLNKVLKAFQLDCPKAIELAQKLYEDKYLDKCVENNMPYSEVYDNLCKMLGY